MSRTETKYNKLVGKLDDEYYFLDETFVYDDNFKGATGKALCPVSKEEYEQVTDLDNVKDLLKEIWQQAVESDNTELGLDDWVQMVIDTDGVEEVVFDTSGWYGKEWDELRALGYSEEEYPVFEWSRCGRIFSKNMKFDEVYAPELIKEINKVEV